LVNPFKQFLFSLCQVKYQKLYFSQASQELLHWNQTWHFVPTEVFNMCADWKFKMAVNWGQSLHRNLQEIQFSLALVHVPPFTVTKHLYKVQYTLCICKCVHLNKVYYEFQPWRKNRQTSSSLIDQVHVQEWTHESLSPSNSYIIVHYSHWLFFTFPAAHCRHGQG
jgi:hypothetical protein